MEDRESYQCRVARKAALSNWLAEAAKEKISQEVDEANFQVSSLLSSNAISRLTLKIQRKMLQDFGTSMGDSVTVTVSENYI